MWGSKCKDYIHFTRAGSMSHGTFSKENVMKIITCEIF